MAGTVGPPPAPKAAPAPDGLRTGWTTGTCAAAAAKAAMIGLVTGAAPSEVEVGLPGGRRVAFAVESGPPHRCIVVKDAGDDPDCTDGARMTAEVAWAEAFPPGSTGPFLRAGEGIGVVTKPGLGLPVGEASITPVPRRMITAALAEADTLLPAQGGRSGPVPPALKGRSGPVPPALKGRSGPEPPALKGRSGPVPSALKGRSGPPVVVTFSVPGGEGMAAKTSNARLGIVGGISILGTTGVVKPFSTAAYRASVIQQIDVAAAQGAEVIVLCTGTRSDAFAQQALPHLPQVCFVEVGDFTGIALRRAARNGIGRVIWVGMVGKITKLAGGVMMTHFRRSAVDTSLLAAVARQAGAPAAVVASATETATARHFYESCLEAGTLEPLVLLCQLAAAACRVHVEDALDVDVVCVDFDGTVEVARG